MRILCACEKNQKKKQKDKSPVTFKYTESFLECPSVLLPGVAERREFTLDYLLQLWLFAYICASMEKHVFVMCSLAL